jgi:hypothetical protein
LSIKPKRENSEVYRYDVEMNKNLLIVSPNNLLCCKLLFAIKQKGHNNIIDSIMPISIKNDIFKLITKTIKKINNNFL